MFKNGIRQHITRITTTTSSSSSSLYYSPLLTITINTTAAPSSILYSTTSNTPHQQYIHNKTKQHKTKQTNMSDPNQAEMNAMVEEWKGKLVGKKIVDDHSGDTNTFAKRDLPDGNHRIVAPGSMMTMDYKPERLNVHVDQDGKCTHVRMG